MNIPLAPKVSWGGKGGFVPKSYVILINRVKLPFEWNATCLVLQRVFLWMSLCQAQIFHKFLYATFKIENKTKILKSQENQLLWGSEWQASQVCHLLQGLKVPGSNLDNDSILNWKWRGIFEIQNIHYIVCVHWWLETMW